MRFARLLAAACCWLFAARAVVDDQGRYRAGSDFTHLAPPEPTDEDKQASVNLSNQPIEKLFRLLAYELWKEEKRPQERRLSIREFQQLTDLDCTGRLVNFAQEANLVSEDIRAYHLNVTGTAGLYWMLHEYPEEHSWVWLLSVSQQRTLQKVEHHLSRLIPFALDDAAGCLSNNFRTVLMNSVAVWKRLHGDYISLLWNGVAFGILGDVTSWREVDEETEEVQDGPSGPPPNVSWSENIIFANMWTSSVQRWVEHHAQELSQSAYTELAHLHGQANLVRDDGALRRSLPGALSSFNFLRNQVFGHWTIDRGLVRALLRAWRPSYGDGPRLSVGDFGSGGGKYSEWFNETGLIEAFAFDAAPGAADISAGSVLEVDLATDVRLWRSFAWVICLNVGELLSLDRGAALLRTARQHAEHGLVMSWSPDAAGEGHVSPLSEPEFVKFVEQETGFSLDSALTDSVRRGCEQEIFKETVAVFRAPPHGSD